MDTKSNARWICLLTSLWLGWSANVTAANDAVKQDMSNKVGAAAGAIKNYTVAQKDEAIKHAKATLDELDARIKQTEDRLDKEWNHMDKAARETSRTSMRNLREQRTELADWYGQLKQSSATVWEQVQHSFIESYELVRESVAKIQKEF